MQNMIICPNNLINYISIAEVHGFVCDLRPHRSLTPQSKKSCPPRVGPKKTIKPYRSHAPFFPQKHDGHLPKKILGFQPTPIFFEDSGVQLKNAPHLGVGKYIN